MNQGNSNKSLDENQSNRPLDLLKSGQLLSLAYNQSSGLIIKKPYYAELVNPGSAIGGMFDMNCVTIYTLGKVEFTVPSNLDERQQAFQSRKVDIENVQKVCEADSPLQRAVDILQLLCNSFEIHEVQTIPNDVLAQLVGVLPSTIALAWQRGPGKVSAVSNNSAENKSSEGELLSNAMLV